MFVTQEYSETSNVVDRNKIQVFVCKIIVHG